MDGGGERAEHEIKASITRPQLWLRAVGGARMTETTHGRVTPPRGLKPEAEGGKEQKRGDEKEKLKEEVFRKREERRKQGLCEGRGQGRKPGRLSVGILIIHFFRLELIKLLSQRPSLNTRTHSALSTSSILLQRWRRPANSSHRDVCQAAAGRGDKACFMITMETTPSPAG